MRRRDFVRAIVGFMTAWPLAARAQQEQRVRRIGVLMGDFPQNAPEGQAVAAAFREELQKLGWTEGRNIRIDYRWAAADIEAMQRFAKELVGSQPELIFSTNTPATATLLQQTRTIPIPNRVRSGYRSGWQRFCGQHSAPGRQCHRFHHDGADDARQVGGTAQGNCATRQPGRYAVQPDNGDIFRILSEPLQSRRSVLRGGPDRSTCS